MKKGALPAIAIAAIVMVAITLIWGIIIHWAIGEHESIVRSVREREIIKLINDMEWNKRVMPQVLEYSFYQSSYSLASKGGYFNPNEVPSYNCIPYWRIYDRTYIPDSIEENLNKTFIAYMNEYANALRLGLPRYDVQYQEDGDNVVVSITSSENLEMERGIAKVEDESDFTGKFNVNIFKLFEKGKNFVDEDKISSAVQNSLGACNEIKDTITSELKQIENDGIEFKIMDAQSDCNGNAAAVILVKISGAEKYPVYDYIENTTSLRNVQLKFYIVAGNSELISPETNPCEH